MTLILNEKEVLSKVKNPLVLKLYKDFFDKTGLSINFENFIGRVRAESKYQRGS